MNKDLRNTVSIPVSPSTSVPIAMVIGFMLLLPQLSHQCTLEQALVDSFGYYHGSNTTWGPIFVLLHVSVSFPQSPISTFVPSWGICGVIRTVSKDPLPTETSHGALGCVLFGDTGSATLEFTAGSSQVFPAILLFCFDT